MPSIIEYDEIFVRFQLKADDQFDEDESRDVMTMWLNMGMSDPYLHDIFSSLEYDNDLEEVTFELKLPSYSTAVDVEYVTDLLAMEMVVRWLERPVRSITNVLQMFGGKEESFYSQSSHLHEIRALLEDTKVDIKKKIAERGGFYNGYLEDK